MPGTSSKITGKFVDPLTYAIAPDWRPHWNEWNSFQLLSIKPQKENLKSATGIVYLSGFRTGSKIITDINPRSSNKDVDTFLLDCPIVDPCQRNTIINGAYV